MAFDSGAAVRERIEEMRRASMAVPLFAAPPSPPPPPDEPPFGGEVPKAWTAMLPPSQRPAPETLPDSVMKAPIPKPDWTTVKERVGGSTADMMKPMSAPMPRNDVPQKNWTPMSEEVLAGAPVASLAKPLAGPPPARPAKPAPAPVAAAKPAPVESGILPGEEQVTTAATLGRLTPAEAAALQTQYKSSGTAKSISYEDWLANNFDDMPPDARLAAMREASVPSNLAAERQAQGKFLPEGLDEHVYSPLQRKVMTRNYNHPEIPMKFGHGPTVINPDGTESMRAPNPQLVAAAQALPPGSPDRVRALAEAYGIDTRKYGPGDFPLLQADTMKLHKIHERQLAVSKVVDVGGQEFPTGQYRYAVDPDKAATVKAARDAAMTDRDRKRMADSIRHRFAAHPDMVSQVDPHTNQVLRGTLDAHLDTLAHTPDGVQQLRDLDQQLQSWQRMNAQRAIVNRRQNENMTRDLANPNLNTGMLIRSLQSAVNDPMQMAIYYDYIGNTRAAEHLRAIAAQQHSDAAQLVAHKNELAAVNQPKPTMAQQLEDQYKDAFATDSATDRYDKVRTIVAQNPANKNMPPAQIEAEVRRVIAGRLARTKPRSPEVQNYLRELRGNKQAFMDFVTENITPDRMQAEEMWKQSNNYRTAQQVGTDAAKSVISGAQGIGNFLYGAGKGMYDAFNRK